MKRKLKVEVYITTKLKFESFKKILDAVLEECDCEPVKSYDVLLLSREEIP